jgi:hypothetical protein
MLMTDLLCLGCRCIHCGISAAVAKNVGPYKTPTKFQAYDRAEG